jgi:hypothetical protein
MLELEHLGLNKTMSPIEACESIIVLSTYDVTAESRGLSRQHESGLFSRFNRHHLMAQLIFNFSLPLYVKIRTKSL